MSDEAEPRPTVLPLEVLDRIDRACDRFEASWQAGERHRLEDYLDGVAAAYRSAMLRNLLAVELDARLRRGERPEPAEYADRFPADGEVIAAAFEEIRVESSDPTPTRSWPTAADFASPVAGDFDGTETSLADDIAVDGGRFRVLRAHARGGLGAVFVALDTELHREVALKRMRRRQARDPACRSRFLQEAEITGGLEHPGIVPVYGLGDSDDDRPFYAMRLIRGDSLKDAIDAFHADEILRRDARARSLELRKLLGRFIDVCDTIEYAHSRGVLHRDIKPSNVVVGKHGETLVVDWGLAKPLGRATTGSDADEQPLTPSSTVGSAETLAGSVLGTPAYMSPEQASGHRDELGPRSDVYGLGATLYCVLTGRRPFEGEDVEDVLRAVQRGAFSPPRQINPALDRALEAVCLKGMALRPHDRYPSARALADDLERWLADEPVSVYREPLSTRATRWGRRHRTLAAAAGVLLITTVAALAISTALIGREQALTERQRRQAVMNFAEASRQRNLAASKTREANEKAATLERQLYVHRINLAHRVYQEDVARAEQLLDQCPPAHRGWEWAYLKRLCHLDLLTFRGHAQGVQSLAFSPDGTMIASGDVKEYGSPWSGDHAELIIWDTRTGRERRRLRGIPGSVNAVSFSADGSRILVGSGYYDKPPGGEGRVTLWEVATGHSLLEKRVSYRIPLAVAFSPDQSLIAAGCGIAASDFVTGRFMLWEAASGRVVLDQEVSKGGVASLAFSPDGKRVVLACKDLVELWDVTPPRKVREFRGHEGWVNGVAFSPEGKILATGGWDRTVRLWNFETEGPFLTIDKHDGRVTAVAFSPDGRQVVSSGGDRTVRTWEIPSGRGLLTMRGHTRGVNGVAFSRDGERIASASDDGTVRLWDAKTDGRVSFREHRRWVNALAFAPDGRSVATGDGDGVIAVWDPATGRRRLRLEGRNGWVNSVAFSPDGARLASTGEYGQLHVWDTATGARVRTIENLDVFARGVAFSPDGKRLVSCTGIHDFIANVPGLIYVWDAGTGAEILRFRGHSGRVLGLAFFPDGDRIASLSSQRPGHPDSVPEILIWRVATGEMIRRLPVEATTLRCLAIGPDGRQLAAGGDDGVVRIWDATSGRELRRIVAASQPVLSMAFSPDGARLAIGGYEESIKLWDPTAVEAILTLSGHTDGIAALVFSSDGRRLASASMDQTARIWDATPLADEGVAP
jgi:WD40 repeat protein/tRNA A-37 threonylcarbamoyl transferase component Bud32